MESNLRLVQAVAAVETGFNYSLMTIVGRSRYLAINLVSLKCRFT